MAFPQNSSTVPQAATLLTEAPSQQAWPPENTPNAPITGLQMKGDSITQLLYSRLARLTAELNGKYKTSIVSAFAGRARPNGPERDLATFRRAAASLKPLLFPPEGLDVKCGEGNIVCFAALFSKFFSSSSNSVYDVSTIFLLQQIWPMCLESSIVFFVCVLIHQISCFIKVSKMDVTPQLRRALLIHRCTDPFIFLGFLQCLTGTS